MSTLIEKLGDFVYGLSYDDLSTDVLDMAKLSVLHHLYTGYSGINEVDSEIALSYIQENLRCAGKCTILGQKAKTSAIGATFINAVYMHSVQQEDTLRGLHPGPHTIPTALAIGEENDDIGKNFITAIVAGYEVNLKIGEFCAKYSGPRGWRGTTIYGILGSTATAAKALKLSRAQIMDAFAMSTNLASGLMQCWLTGTPEWLFTSGLAAQNGIISALLAKKGSAGAQNSFEGERGFYKAYCGAEPEDADKIIGTLGKKFSILDVVLKPYSVITSILPVVHNMAVLASRNSINYEDVIEILVTAGPKVTEGPLSQSVLDNGPFLNKTQAYKSLPCALGIALRHHEVTPMTVEDYQDSAISEIAKKVVIKTDSSFESYYNTIDLKMRDGSVHSIRGEEFPTLDPQKVHDNFIRASLPFLNKKRALIAAEVILTIEDKPIRDLSKILR
jgi:2-methylcitrate dehydratase PrpD